MGYIDVAILKLIMDTYISQHICSSFVRNNAQFLMNDIDHNDVPYSDMIGC